MQIRFMSLSESLQRLTEVIKAIPDLLRDPSANPIQAAILLGIVLVLALIVLVSVVLVIMRPSRAEELEYEQYGEASQASEPEEELSPEDRRLGNVTVSAVVLLVFVLVWIVAGITTSSPAVCTSCHTNTVHSAASADDPHAKVTCVSCHETGGSVARSTVNLATRVQHFIVAAVSPSLAVGFGAPVASDGCLRCHQSVMRGTHVNVRQGVRVSHAEPIAAGAACVDCHTLNRGVVNATTVGMSPCLRCHDGKAASAECSVCHVGDPSGAIQANIAPGSMASQQVPNPQCGSCHFDMSRCDACHGIRMPHSLAFMAYGHARPAAIDIWTFGTDKTCQKCHYSGHNACTKPGCHLAPVPDGHPNPAWGVLHRAAPWGAGTQSACSCHNWNPYDHAGAIYCRICHAVKPRNAR